MDDKEKRWTQDLIDASLRHYTNAEPRAGLERRILASVRARRGAERRRRAWTWAAGTAAVAATVALLVIHPPHRQRVQRPETRQARATEAHGQNGTDRGYQLAAPTIAESAPPVHPIMPRRSLRRAPARRVDTRPQQFPTPRPLSEQETLLLLYAQSLKGNAAAAAPDEEHEPEHDLELPPLTIAVIKIDPLPSAAKMADQR